jgi:hypothetical protein
VPVFPSAETSSIPSAKYLSGDSSRSGLTGRLTKLVNAP